MEWVADVVDAGLRLDKFLAAPERTGGPCTVGTVGTVGAAGRPEEAADAPR